MSTESYVLLIRLACIKNDKERAPQITKFLFWFGLGVFLKGLSISQLCLFQRFSGFIFKGPNLFLSDLDKVKGPE